MVSPETDGEEPPTKTTFTGLTNGLVYSFQVVAVNAFGHSPRSLPSDKVCIDWGFCNCWYFQSTTFTFLKTFPYEYLEVARTSMTYCWFCLMMIASTWEYSKGEHGGHRYCCRVVLS